MPDDRIVAHNPLSPVPAGLPPCFLSVPQEARDAFKALRIECFHNSACFASLFNDVSSVVCLRDVMFLKFPRLLKETVSFSDLGCAYRTFTSSVTKYVS